MKKLIEQLRVLHIDTFGFNPDIIFIGDDEFFRLDQEMRFELSDSMAKIMAITRTEYNGMEVLINPNYTGVSVFTKKQEPVELLINQNERLSSTSDEMFRM